MLTEKQLKRRQRTIGASEVAAIVGVDPRRGPIDVFARKRRGRDAEHDPIVVEPLPEPDKPLAVAGMIDTEPRQLGGIFEGALGDAYATRTGHRVTRWQQHIVHPDHPWVSCTPDVAINTQMASAPEGGGELKMVGHWMRGDWPAEGIPPYVVTQCQWCMFVTGLSWWDVTALVDGTDLRIVRVERDDTMIRDMFEIAEAFWFGCVVADQMPMDATPQSVMQVVVERWRQDNGKTLEVDDDQLTEAARLFAIAHEVERAAKQVKAAAKAALVARCGPYRKLVGPWGSLSFPTKPGSVSWKAIAEELAGGVIDEELLEKHRGDAYRDARVYPHKRWKQRRLDEVAEDLGAVERLLKGTT